MNNNLNFFLKSKFENLNDFTSKDKDTIEILLGIFLELF